MRKHRHLRMELTRRSVLAITLTLVIFMASTLIHLRYGMKSVRVTHFSRSFRLDLSARTCISMGMATKTISIDSEAYLRLRKARTHPGESFSQVIRRGHWDEKGATAHSWLESFAHVPEVDEAVLEALEANQKADKAPGDKWA